MSVKRFVLFIALIACALTASAQDELTFEPDTWNFGAIRESDGKVSHVFTGTNRTDRPIVILDVITSCGCTAPAFSKKPILPGRTTEIRVTYDPTDRPGAFTKRLTVYSSDRRKIAQLTVAGEVLPREKSTEELYPVDAGGGLRLTATTLPFSYVYIGRRAQSAVGYANVSSRTLMFELRGAEPGGPLEVHAPRTIAPGERGEIDLGFFVPADRPRYGTLKAALTPVIDGRASEVRLFVHAIAVDAPPAAGANSPVPELRIPKNIVKFGPVKRTDAGQRRSLTLTNGGTAPLTVRTVELPAGIGCSLRGGERIAPGADATMELTLDPSDRDFGPMSVHLLLITDDPARPMRRIRVTAVVEE